MNFARVQIVSSPITLNNLLPSSVAYLRANLFYSAVCSNLENLIACFIFELYAGHV